MEGINRIYLVLIFLITGCSEQSPEDIAQGSLIIDSHIDTELITGMIEKHCLDEGTILSIINFVFDYLKRFQSRSDDKKNKLWQDGINEKFLKKRQMFLS